MHCAKGAGNPETAVFKLYIEHSDCATIKHKHCKLQYMTWKTYVFPRILWADPHRQLRIVAGSDIFTYLVTYLPQVVYISY